MKAIPQNGSNARWSDNLVNELSYIRQHLRYKPKLNRLLPAIFSGIFIILLIVTVAVSIYDKAGRGELPTGVSIMMLAAVLVTFSARTVGYLRSLRFISIPTDYHTTENMALVQNFLKRQHLAHSQHPQIPEVFQILSKNINPGDENREVLIFIAADKKILLNSHFTTSWGFFARRRHHNEMAKMLKDYINNLDRSTGLVHQTF